MNEFSYITDKIVSAGIIKKPYSHLEINNLLSQEHIECILADKQIHFQKSDTIEELINILINKGYESISGAGVIQDVAQYLKMQQNKDEEQLGMGFRLCNPSNSLIKSLLSYFQSNIFHQALKDKFNIKGNTRLHADIRKYLSGYEISPHPDMREKAMTMLLNINVPRAKDYDVHTHVLIFKKEYEYMYKKWNKEIDKQREWVPWEWCTTIKTMCENNTIIIFPPGNRSLHAAKLDYPHLEFQRTQVYGNLWRE